MHRLSACFALLLLTTPALGQARVKVPTVADSTIDNVVKVTAPAASLAVVNDRLGLLLFAHHTAYKDAQVSICRLDGAGKPGEPYLLKLPRPDALAKLPAYVSGLAIHPKLPLLYIWQDLEIPKDSNRAPIALGSAETAAITDFDHLLIYSIEKDKPDLVVGMCRAPVFVHDRAVGSVAVDDAGERLYVPNVDPKAKHHGATIGSYVLHPDGIPVVGDAEAGKRDPLAKHVSAIQEANKAKKPAAPQRIATPFSAYQFFCDTPAGSGVGFIPLARDVVITGGFHSIGMVTWTPDDRRVRLQSYSQLPGHYTYKFPAAHPTLPLVFVSDSLSTVYRFEHVDGNPTLMPTRAELEAVHLCSPAVVMGKANKIVVGGIHRLFILSLNDKGRFKPERQQVLIAPNQRVEAVAYSAKYDRIYVGVEKEKKK
jgi:hypothetical protein